MTMTEILLAARAEGLSYGQYVAKHRPHTSFEELEDAKMLNKRRYMGESSVLVCKNCGKAFMQKKNPAQFCSHLCADAYRRIQWYAKSAGHPFKRTGRAKKHAQMNAQESASKRWIESATWLKRVQLGKHQSLGPA